MGDKTVLVFSLVLGFLGYMALNPASNIPFLGDDIPTQISSQISENFETKVRDFEEIQKRAAELVENREDLTLERSQREWKIEQEVHRLINLERETQELKPLKYDVELGLVSKLHSFDMYERRYFAHENPDGQSPTGRGADIQYYCIKINGIYISSGIAENIFMINGTRITFWDTPLAIAELAVDGWMNSEGHRKNILESKYEKEGIGVILSDYSVFITQNFC